MRNHISSYHYQNAALQFFFLDAQISFLFYFWCLSILVKCLVEIENPHANNNPLSKCPRARHSLYQLTLIVTSLQKVARHFSSVAQWECANPSVSSNWSTYSVLFCGRNPCNQCGISRYVGFSNLWNSYQQWRNVTGVSLLSNMLISPLCCSSLLIYLALVLWRQ